MTPKTLNNLPGQPARVSILVPWLYLKEVRLLIKQEASDNVKRRLKFKTICPLCGQEIQEIDDFQFVKYPVGRCKWYTFFHTKCLLEYETGIRRS